MKKILDVIKIILLFLLILFMVFFSISNSDLVMINFDIFPFNFSFEIRLFLLIIFCFSFGCLTGIFITSLTLLKKQFDLFKYKKKANKLEKEINNINTNKTEKENE